MDPADPRGTWSATANVTREKSPKASIRELPVMGTLISIVSLNELGHWPFGNHLSIPAAKTIKPKVSNSGVCPTQPTRLIGVSPVQAGLNEGVHRHHRRDHAQPFGRPLSGRNPLFHGRCGEGRRIGGIERPAALGAAALRQPVERVAAAQAITRRGHASPHSRGRSTLALGRGTTRPTTPHPHSPRRGRRMNSPR